MISLAMKPEPFDIELVPGIVVKVKPLTTFSYTLAQARARAKLQTLSDSTGVCFDAGILPKEDVIDLRDKEQADTLFEIILGKELALEHIISWVGVVDNNDKPVEVTPETVTALMEMFPFSIVFQQEIQRGMRKFYQAKKGSGVAPSGTSNPVPAPNTANSADANN